MSKPDPKPLTPDFLRERIANSLQPWRQALEAFNVEQLNQPDPNGGWTLGQVYTHCYLAASRLFLTSAEACIEEGVVDQPGQLNENGEKMFTYQSFPPIEIKMPEGVSFTPPVPDTQERLTEQLDKIDARTEAVIAALEANPEINATSSHFAFGDMNAAQWVLMASMHYDHHLRQKKRLEAAIS